VRSGRAGQAVEVDRITHLHELRERFEQFKRRDLSDIRVAALFLDAMFLSVRPDGPKEGVLVGWGFTGEGERVLLWVMLGMRESHEDWLEPGRDLIARGLGAPLLVVADGAPGLIKAIEQCWPASDRQHCCVHHVRNLLAKLPDLERESVRRAYWQALDDATGEHDGKQRLKALVDELDRPATPPPRSIWATTWTRLSCTCATRPTPPPMAINESARAIAGRSQAPHQGDRPLPGETSCLTVVWAVLDFYITHATNGIKFTQLERQRLKRLRYWGDEQAIPAEVNAA
jgi:putative transposase